MIIQVEVFGNLLPEGKRLHQIDLAAPCPVRKIAEQLHLDLEKVGIITINGVVSEEDGILAQDCRLCFFPHMSGG